MELSPWVKLPLWGVLGLLAFLGLFALADVLNWLVFPGAVVAVLVLLGLARVSEFCRALAEVVGAIAIPWLCLLGFNLVWRGFDKVWHALFGTHVRPGLWLGLVLACVVFAIAAAGYLIAWREKKWATPAVAVGLALANVIGIPLLITVPREEKPVDAQASIRSKVDVAIVLPSIDPGELRPFKSSRPLPDFDVRYSVARARGAGIDWLLLDSPDSEAALGAAGAGAPVPGTPAFRADADQAVLLDVDGTPPVSLRPASLPSVRGKKGEIARWLSLAQRAAPGAPVAVLLQTTDEARLAAWRQKVEPAGGSVTSVQELGVRSLTDAAFRLAAEAPGTSTDLSLALKFRPILLFDNGERLDTPLDVDAFLASGRVELCHANRVNGSRCDPVKRSADLVNGSTHLKIKRRDLRRDRYPPSSIYVHPTAVKDGDRNLLYLDYWWYLDDNPANVGGGASCGVGLALPGKTCFDHVSDWEGVTLVLDRTAGEATPVALQYAQHGAVVRYDYARLQDDWTRRRTDQRPKRRLRDRLWTSRRFRQNLARIDDVDRRPFVFVARGTHAAYPGLCTENCKQVAESLKEYRHNGLDSWPGNDTAHCITTRCLRLTPTRNRGRDPALWNAYEGVWGHRDCILGGTFCSAEQSPAAPATQKRYDHPDRVTGYVDAKAKFHRCGDEDNPCPALPQPAPQEPTKEDQ